MSQLSKVNFVMASASKGEFLPGALWKRTPEQMQLEA